MPTSRDKNTQRLDDHVSWVQNEYEPDCQVCGRKVLREEGMFNMIGTKPRMPRAFGSLKCPNCGYIMFFELPEVGIDEDSD